MKGLPESVVVDTPAVPIDLPPPGEQRPDRVAVVRIAEICPEKIDRGLDGRRRRIAAADRVTKPAKAAWEEAKPRTTAPKVGRILMAIMWL